MSNDFAKEAELSEVTLAVTEQQADEALEQMSGQLDSIEESFKQATVKSFAEDREVFCCTCREYVSVGGCKHVSKCEQCGAIRQLGDWPCSSKRPCSGSTRHLNAQRFDPIRVYKNPDGTFYFPGRNDGSDAPPGLEPIDVTSIRQWDTIERAENARLDENLHLRVEANRVHREETTKRNRAELYAQLDRRGISRKAADEIIADRDERRSKANFARVQRSNFTSEVFSQDASNREVYRDADNGWRGRKG